MKTYTYRAIDKTIADSTRIEEIWSWMHKNVKSKNWQTFYTQRSNYVDFIFFKKQDYALFLLSWS